LNSYKTVLNLGVSEYEEKKSRFISSVMPVEEEAKAIQFINEIRAKYWDATHNCYAYSILSDTLVQRYSDDGEPSGTAGLPILEIIKRTEIQNAVVVVTRYFGGTLLGAGGLVRSYSKSAAEGIHNAKIVFKKPYRAITVNVDYHLSGKISNYLLSNDYLIKDTVYNEQVSYTILIELLNIDRFCKSIVELTNARAFIEKREELWVSTDDNGKLV